MFASDLFKTTRTILDRVPWTLLNELSTLDEKERISESEREFLDRVQRIFAERGYENVDREITLEGEFLLFTRSEVLHLVYCLPCERYVTTIEIQSCWEMQCRLGADSSSVVAPYRFSQAAIDKAMSLAIEFLVVRTNSIEISR